MAVESHQIEVKTRGNNHVVNITDEVARCVESSEISSGTATVFVIGSTGGVTTTEFEPGLADHDLEAAFEGIAPRDGRYRHEETWHDDNGHAHVRASLLGPSLTVPFNDRRLHLGTWQQIVLLDFDTRPRSRRIVVQVLGE
jgi:secondary thiamine-phosphate synthase enzyme